MSRVIKFRAWNGERMEDMDALICGEYDNNMMQFTGLTDRNGVEIYEGDWIAFSYYGARGKQEVEFSEGCFGVNCNDLNGPGADWSPLYDLDDVEVIGNIHEHPDLLEGE